MKSDLVKQVPGRWGGGTATNNGSSLPSPRGLQATDDNLYLCSENQSLGTNLKTQQGVVQGAGKVFYHPSLLSLVDGDSI